jgi:hypothetical protein
MFSKLSLTALVALAPLTALSAQSADDGRTAATDTTAQTTTERASSQRRERLMCRRVGLTGQPTSMRRVCKTAAEWREIDDAED